MSRQRGRHDPRTTPEPAAQTGEVGFRSVPVAGDAIANFSTLAANPDAGIAGRGIDAHLSVSDLRNSIGADGIRQAAINAGRRPPSDRTIRRWVKNNRIPHDGVDMRAQRRALVERNGGVAETASRLGVSPSTVSRYQQGVTTQFRSGRTRRAEARVQAGDALNRAGLADARGQLLRTPTISITATFEYRNDGKSSGDYRGARGFDIAGMNADDAQSFAHSIASGDHASAIAAIEQHLTLDYATTFADYDADTGFHIESINDFSIDWGLEE